MVLLKEPARREGARNAGTMALLRNRYVSMVVGPLAGGAMTDVLTIPATILKVSAMVLLAAMIMFTAVKYRTNANANTTQSMAAKK